MNARYRLIAATRHAALGLAAFLAAIAATGNVPLRSQVTDSIDVRTIQGLAERRLFALARFHAEDCLANSTDSAERVRLAVALIEAMTQQAMISLPENREAAWSDVVRAGQEWIRALDAEPQAILLHVQVWLIDLARLEQMVREIELGQLEAHSIEDASALFLRIRHESQGLAHQVLQDLNLAASARKPGGMTAEALRSLRYHIEYQSARAQMLAGELYPESELTSRIDAMNQAEKGFGQCLQSVGPEQAIWWSIQADRIRAARVAGNGSLIAQIVTSLPSTPPDEISGRRILAERILVHLASNQFADAAKLAGEDPAASSLPELDLARLRLFAAMAEADPPQKEVWQKRALNLTSAIEELHGGYWGRRANMLVVGTASSSPDRNNLDLLIRVATEAQARKQWPEAVEALDAAVEQALAANDREMASRLGFLAAAIEQEQTHFAEAARRFETVATQNPEWPQAHAAQLLACWNLSRVPENDPEKEARYEQMLVYLIQTWRDTDSADQARIWLAEVRQSQKAWKDALVLLANVRPGGNHYSDALDRIRLLIPVYLDSNPETRGDQDEWLAGLAKSLDSAAEPQSPLRQIIESDESRHGAWLSLLGELRWIYGVPSARDVSEEIRELLGNPAFESRAPHWSTLLMVRAAWENGEWQELEDALLNLSPSPETLELLRAGLAGSYHSKSPTPACHKLLRAAADRFSQAIASDTTGNRYSWDRSLFDAVVSLDEPGAVEELRSIAAWHPRDLEIQLQLGRFWLTVVAREPGQVDGALGHWRKIAAATRSGSEEWLEAKLNVARLLVAAGKPADARAMLEYLRAIPPGWSHSKLAPEFDQLLAEIPKEPEPEK